MANKLSPERQKKIDHVAEKALELREAIDQLSDTDEIRYIGRRLRLAINYTLQRLDPRPPRTVEERRADHIRSAELALEAAEARYKKNKHYFDHQVYTDKGKKYPDVSAEDLEELRESVERCRLQVARLKGDDMNFIERKKAELLEKKRQERLEEARGVREAQERAQALKKKGK